MIACKTKSILEKLKFAKVWVIRQENYNKFMDLDLYSILEIIKGRVKLKFKKFL